MARPRSERERQIDEEIVALHRIFDLAEAGAKTADAVKAMERIGRLRAELERLKAVRMAGSIADPIKRLRRLGEIAAADGSWVASTNYAKDAARLELEREIAEREADVREMLDQDQESLVLVLLEAATAIPRTAAISLGRALLARPDLGADDLVDG